MRCPALADLPPPPAGRYGWPWDVESARMAETAADGKPWPVVSIVTPSYNQGRYIEETIRSVLLQGYPHLEFHVIDGGSSDETVEILRKYEPWLNSWVSERDSGQSEAINKGFARCSGELFNWLCSDDVLTRDSLQAVAKGFQSRPRLDVLAGGCVFQYDDEPHKSHARALEWRHWHDAPHSGVIWQPSCFFRRSIVSRGFLVRSDLHFCMDRELWAYLHSLGTKWDRTDDVLSVFRFTGCNKTVTGGEKVIDELDDIHRSYFSEILPLSLLLRNVWLPLVRISTGQNRKGARFVSGILSRAVTLALLVTYKRGKVRALQSDFYHYGLSQPAE